VAWKAVLRPTTAGGRYTITASTGKQSISLADVTFGDVFFCSGQSNMVCRPAAQILD